MKFYLLRHGQTRWNIEGKIQGKTDIPLNEAGLSQAGFLAAAMEGCGAKALYSSPLLRARQTAEEVAEKTGLTVRVLPELQEVDFGLWEGNNWAFIGQNYPEDYKKWEINPAGTTPTGGEDRRSCQERIRNAVEQVIKESAGGDVIIVAHGGILVYIISYLLRNQSEKREIIVKNASISVIHYNEITGLGFLSVLNDTTHLPEARGGKTNKYC